MAKTNKQEAQTFEITVKGNVYYPRTKDGKYSAAIAVSREDIRLIDKGVHDTFGVDFEFKEHEDLGTLLNVKSNYTPVVVDYATKKRQYVDDDHTKGYIRVNHGAEVYAKVRFAEWSYMKKTGIACYLLGYVLVENTQSNENRSEDNFKSLMGRYGE